MMTFVSVWLVMLLHDGQPLKMKSPDQQTAAACASRQRCSREPKKREFPFIRTPAFGTSSGIESGKELGFTAYELLAREIIGVTQ